MCTYYLQINSLPVCFPFAFRCFIAPLNRYGERGHNFVLFLILAEMLWVPPPLSKLMLAMSFLQAASLQDLYHRMMDFVKGLLPDFVKGLLPLKRWPCGFYLSVWLSGGLFYWFTYVEPSLYLWGEAPLITVDEVVVMFLGSICKYFIENFCSYVHSKTVL